VFPGICTDILAAPRWRANLQCSNCGCGEVRMVEYGTFQLLYAVLMDFISHNLYQYKHIYEAVTHCYHHYHIIFITSIFLQLTALNLRNSSPLLDSC